MADQHSFDTEHAMLYGLEEAVMINSLKWWVRKNRANGKNLHDGRTWTYNSYEALAKLFPYWTPRKTRRILDSLTSKGVLVKEQMRLRPGAVSDGGDATNWYAFVDEHRFLGPAEDHLPKTADPHLPKRADAPQVLESDLPISADHLPISADVYKEQLGTQLRTEEQRLSTNPHPLGSREYRRWEWQQGEGATAFASAPEGECRGFEASPADTEREKPAPVTAAPREASNRRAESDPREEVPAVEKPRRPNYTAALEAYFERTVTGMDAERLENVLTLQRKFGREFTPEQLLTAAKSANRRCREHHGNKPPRTFKPLEEVLAEGNPDPAAEFRALAADPDLPFHHRQYYAQQAAAASGEPQPLPQAEWDALTPDQQKAADYKRWSMALMKATFPERYGPPANPAAPPAH